MGRCLWNRVCFVWLWSHYCGMHLNVFSEIQAISSHHPGLHWPYFLLAPAGILCTINSEKGYQVAFSHSLFQSSIQEQHQFKILLYHEQVPSLNLPNWWLCFDTMMCCKQRSVAVQLEHHLAAYTHTHPLTTAPLTITNSKFRISVCCYYEFL